MNNYALERDLLEVLGPVLQRHGLTYQALSVERVRRRFFEAKGGDRIFLVVEGREG